ncbi:MAG TPA: hypothetical protein VFD38_09115, partial [Myxococcaceae bacterium]|nr:hypothetical protein [Myxococcaceae bacterium]
MRRSLVLVAVLVVAGALAAVVLRRPAAPPPPPTVTALVSTPASDAGLTDDEVFSASMARLAEAKRRADAELAAERVAAATARPPAVEASDAGGLAHGSG